MRTNILVISPTKGEKLIAVRQIPRVGEHMYFGEDYMMVRGIAWYPPKSVLELMKTTWCGYHVSELAGDAAIEAIVRVG